MTVNVIQDDISNGKMLNSCGCPIARAIRKKRGVSSVSVGPSRVHIGDAAYRLPLIARAFINKFDSGLGYKCSPITFTMRRIK